MRENLVLYSYYYVTVYGTGIYLQLDLVCCHAYAPNCISCPVGV